MAGAPEGNQNAAKGRAWRDAINRALRYYPERGVSLEVNKGIDEAAYKFVNNMMTKEDLGFFKEFGDRIDGKPAQAITGGDDDDQPLKVNLVQFGNHHSK